VKGILLLLLTLPLGAAPVRECATCHPAQAQPHPATSMAHAMELVSECTILREHPLLTFTEGKYSYRIERQGDKSIYSVTDGTETLTVPIGWAFGLGVAGQTSVFEKDGELYESRVSFYTELNGLDLTIGARNLRPTNLLQAAGRFMGPDEKVRCFGCHSTNARQGMKLTLASLTPGVQCERCHGETTNHPQSRPMKHLKSLSTEDLSNFCGQCHRTWEEVAAGGTLGVANIRFQPYRLTNSKCYDTEDARISCLGCHNPHQEINRSDASYDSRCLACHTAGGKPSAKICKVAKENCVSCHMPKLELPDSHHKFTDHQIRIVRTHDVYPN
jgi:Zn finger protein HypA/HybF involved in hydrogenase expression